jgi:hypothetical protein
LGPIVVFSDYCNQTRQFIPTSRKALSNAKLRVTHKKGLVVLGFRYTFKKKKKPVNEWKCLDEKMKWMKILNEKIIDPDKSDKALPLEYH